MGSICGIEGINLIAVAHRHPRRVRVEDLRCLIAEKRPAVRHLVSNAEGDEPTVIPLPADLELIEAAIAGLLGQVNMRCRVVEESFNGEIAIRVSIELVGGPDAPGDPEVIPAGVVVWAGDGDVLQALVCSLSSRRLSLDACQAQDRLTHLPKYFAHALKLNVANARNTEARKIIMLIIRVIGRCFWNMKTTLSSPNDQSLAHAAIYSH